MEHDYLEVFVSAGCIPQEVCTPLHVRGCGGSGGLIPPRLGGPGASDFPVGVSGEAPLKLKIDVNLPCKSIVISSQSGPFIRRMI